MADRRTGPKASASKRDVSPLGASKFERPYSPSAVRAPIIPATSLDKAVHLSEPSSASPRTSTNTNGTADTSPSLPDEAALQFSQPSLVSTVPTVYSNSSANTSIDRFEQALDAISNSECASPEDRNAWFMKHVEEDDLDLPVETDECPDGAVLAAVQNIPIYDEAGEARLFGSLYDPETTTNERQLIIFIRHTFCGACHAFVRALTDGISASECESMPSPTSIVLIGCGKPDLIQHYRDFQGCDTHFPIYAEPTRKLFKTLGMKWSAKFGDRPEYMRDISLYNMVKGSAKGISADFKEDGGLRKRDIVRGGNWLQVGGEFLFENGSVVWCHRMRNIRGRKSHVLFLPKLHFLTHAADAEVAVLRKLLELDNETT